LSSNVAGQKKFLHSFFSAATIVPSKLYGDGYRVLRGNLSSNVTGQNPNSQFQILLPIMGYVPDSGQEGDGLRQPRTTSAIPLLCSKSPTSPSGSASDL
jgi:hypothetical protein